MTPAIRRMTSRELERILLRYGFEMVSQQGSHRKWRQQLRRLQVIVPEHKGKTLPIGTLRNILVDAQIPEEEWKT
jgi:predicted RNA binding protein YcfA (HicA-like mRNA interferase family)